MEEDSTPVILVSDEYGNITAVLPNGKRKKLLVHIYGNPYYGTVQLDSGEDDE